MEKGKIGRFDDENSVFVGRFKNLHKINLSTNDFNSV